MEHIHRKDIAKIIRADLKRAFPKTKFSVRCRSWSMGGEIAVNWADGPTRHSVEKLIGKYQDRGFDGMIDLAYNYWHWLLPDGSIELGGTNGTAGSRGTVEAFETTKPHPDAMRVHLHTGYVSCLREESQAFRDNVRRAWIALSERERAALINKTDALRCLSPYEMPQSWRYDDDLSDFSVNAGRIFDRIAHQIAA